MNSMFSKPKNPKLAKAIKITTPAAFRSSISRVRSMKGIPAITKKRALVLAKNRAKVQLERSNLSARERRQFEKIARTRINL